MVHIALIARWIELAIHVDMYRDVEDIWVVVECFLTAVTWRK
jgi:hypothetical protein